MVRCERAPQHARGSGGSPLTGGERTYFVGYFEDETEAAKAYDAAILPLAGMFARPNFPEESRAAAPAFPAYTECEDPELVRVLSAKGL